MSRQSVYVTRMIPGPAIGLLKQHFDVDVSLKNGVLSRAELLEGVRGRHGILCLLTDRIDAGVFDAAGPQCRVFANYAVGYDNIDVKEATRRGIVVTNTPDVLTEATADLAWALLFAVSRRIVESDGFMRSGKYQGWDPGLLLGLDITGRTLGVIGAGRIGRSVASKARGFRMRVLYHDVARSEQLERETGAVYASKHDLLAEADFVSLHVPLNPSTFHFIDEAELRLMKPTAVLINTSRGPVVNEKALARALREKWIWGAGLDVYEQEPRFEADLAALDNVVLTPHTASATIDTRSNMGLIAARNIVSVLTGGKPESCVNPEVLK